MKKTAQPTRTIGSKLAVAGGIGAGIVAMYLFDPRYGKNRRNRIASAIHDLADQGHDLGHRVGERAAHLASAARHHFESARDAGISATESGRDAIRSGLDSAERAREYVERAVENAKAFAADPAKPRQRGTALALSGMALSGMAALVCGLGAMYFLDPANGAKRRKATIDLAAEGIQSTGRAARFAGRQLRSSLQSVAPSIAQYLPDDEKEPADSPRNSDPRSEQVKAAASATIPTGAFDR